MFNSKRKNVQIFFMLSRVKNLSYVILHSAQFLTEKLSLLKSPTPRNE